MTTIKDIANKLGVSISTVSKGLNGGSDISEDLRQLVIDTAADMGYQPKKLKKSNNRKLVIFIRNMTYESPEDFGYDIILGFKKAAMNDGWSVNIVPATPELQKKTPYDEYMKNHAYSGAFCVGFTLNDIWLRQIQDTAYPTVLFDNYIKNNPLVSYLGTDSYEGIDAAITYLYDLGHRKIAFLNGPSYSMISRNRKQAFIESMERHDLIVNNTLNVFGDFSAETAMEHVPNFLAHGVTAIVCSSDIIASGVISECQRRGCRVPNEISVIGFDDLPISASLQPLLTTIRQDRLMLGQTGYLSLHSTLLGVSLSTTLLHPELVIRASTSKRSR